MNNILTEKGVLEYGIIDSEGVCHRDFELKLVTVRDEMRIQALILSQCPNIGELSEQEQSTIERAALLTQMMVRLGTLNTFTIDMCLDLEGSDFTRLLDAEFSLRKKRLEYSHKPAQQAQSD